MKKNIILILTAGVFALSMSARGNNTICKEESMKKQSAKRNYYMGSWHTHPQMVPNPSHIDINDWNQTLREDKTGCNYAFFIIFGIKEFRLWYGDYKSCEIKELKEVERINDYYIKE